GRGRGPRGRPCLGRPAASLASGRPGLRPAERADGKVPQSAGRPTPPAAGSTARPWARKANGPAVRGPGARGPEPRPGQLPQTGTLATGSRPTSGPESAFPATGEGRKARAARHRPNVERRLDRPRFYTTPTRHASSPPSGADFG